MKPQTLPVRLFAAVGALALLVQSEPAQAETVCFDAGTAEHIQAPMRRVDASDKAFAATNTVVEGASENVYLEIPKIENPTDKDKQAQARYSFSVAKAGEYFLWLRVWWDDECSNSFRASLNGQAPFIMGRNRTFRRWHWVKSPPRTKQLNLEKGTHTLAIMYREDRVKLDQILLTTDRRFVPVDIERTTPTE